MPAQAIVEPIRYGSGLVRAYKFSTVTNGDTFVYDNSTNKDAAPPQAWWIENTSDAAKVTATLSSGTFTFAVSTGTPNFTLFILNNNPK